MSPAGLCLLGIAGVAIGGTGDEKAGDATGATIGFGHKLVLLASSTATKIIGKTSELKSSAQEKPAPETGDKLPVPKAHTPLELPSNLEANIMLIWPWSAFNSDAKTPTLPKNLWFKTFSVIPLQKCQKILQKPSLPDSPLDTYQTTNSQESKHISA